MSSSLSRWECFGILGLESSASQDEIRQAYRTKAIDNHPDKNPGDPSATERFQRISEAYRVLANDNNNNVDDSDSDDNYGGGLHFGMFMYFRMFEEIMREVRREEARRRQQRFVEEMFREHLFGVPSWQHDPWQQQPHRRRDTDWSPPRRTSQQSSGRTSQQSSGRTSQQSSGRTSQQSSGRTSQQSSGRTSQQSSGRTSQQSSGRTSQQSSGRTSHQTSGWFQGPKVPRSQGPSSQPKTKRTTPLTRKNTSRPSKENETPRGNYHDKPSSNENTFTSFKNKQGGSSKVSDDEGSKHKPASDPPKEQYANPDQQGHPVGGDQDRIRVQRTTSSNKPQTTYKTYQSTKMSKKQLLAQQKRRAKEAEEIGKELRKKSEQISNPKSS